MELFRRRAVAELPVSNRPQVLADLGAVFCVEVAMLWSKPKVSYYLSGGICRSDTGPASALHSTQLMSPAENKMWCACRDRVCRRASVQWANWFGPAE